MEKEILEAAITYRPDFNELKRLQVEHYLGDDTEVIWRAIEDYYEQDQSAQSIDTKLLRSLVELSHPKHELLHEVISQLEATSGPNILKLVLEQRIYTVSMKLSQAFASGKLGEAEGLRYKRGCERGRHRRNDGEAFGCSPYTDAPKCAERSTRRWPVERSPHCLVRCH